MAKVIDKIAWIEIQDRLVLSTLSKGKTNYYFPGGKREPGESDSQALIREIREELSVDLEEESLRFFGIFQAQADSHPEGVEVKMQCYTGNYSGILKPDSEIAEMVWLLYSDREKVSPVDKIILDYLKEKDLII